MDDKNMIIKTAAWLKANELFSKPSDDAEKYTSIAINALSKQIPMKPIDKTKPDDTASLAYDNCNIIVCPSCSGRLKLKSKGKYCDKCGQALNWEMENGKD